MFVIFVFLVAVLIDAQDFVPINKDAAPKIVPVTVIRPAGTVQRRVFEEDGITYTEIKRILPSGGVQTSHIEGSVEEKPSLIFPKTINLSAILSRVQNKIRKTYPDGLFLKIGNMTDGVLKNVFNFLHGSFDTNE
ncbi:unnamed protein product [Caenorhabditis angaria]|uniref:Uncharacterized protein n=1 Tax=Caenorhabditis angaria TaxID=860376 RepID=A0A9P1IV53_9PELO|nr:unnamed protein product [Caenorhabditis angaria]